MRIEVEVEVEAVLELSTLELWRQGLGLEPWLGLWSLESMTVVCRVGLGVSVGVGVNVGVSAAAAAGDLSLWVVPQ